MKRQFDTDWADAACGPLTLRTAATAAEVQLLRDALQRDHYLGAGRPAGHVLWQGVYELEAESQTEQLVAALCWGGAALRLKDRDEWLGWDPVTRANRLGLVVQLRRFMVVGEARRPNLASRCLALALRTLVKEWRTAHGFAPLLAESFSDPESHQGTLYKVTNWLPMGQTAGYSRSRADFYTDAQKPKLLWLYPLRSDARELLGSPGELPAAQAPGIKDGVAGARCPLKCDQLRSLRQALCRVPDPRSKRSRRHPIGALLGIICLGLLGGARDVMSCWRKGGPLSQEQRRAIGLIRRDKSGRLFLPCYAAFNDLLAAIDPHELASVLNEWLAQNEGTLPRSLAIDGKAIGGLKGGIITLCHQASGAPVAMAVHQGAKNDCEMPVARELLESVQPSLDNAIVTADALHCQKKTARTIVERGGDYLIALNDNQPGLREHARRQLEAAPPLCPPAPKSATAASSSGV